MHEEQMNVGWWWEARNVRIICFTSPRFFFSIFIRWHFSGPSICWWRWRWISGLHDIFFEIRRPPSIWVSVFNSKMDFLLVSLSVAPFFFSFWKEQIKAIHGDDDSIDCSWSNAQCKSEWGEKWRSESKKFDFCRRTCDSMQFIIC